LTPSTASASATPLMGKPQIKRCASNSFGLNSDNDNSSDDDVDDDDHHHHHHPRRHH